MIRPTLYLLLISLLASAPAAASDPRAKEWIERARELRLAQQRGWQTLLHYERRSFPPVRRSAAQTPEFFLAATGRTDAEAELEATLRGLLDPEIRTARGEPVACHFPARAAWLRDQLQLDSDTAPQPPCDELDEWRKNLRPQALTLVFPEAFMNSPASMFGHTLLRIDVSVEEEPQNLLAYAIDFTADTGGEAGPIYLLKGTIGLYPGRFGLNPYHLKLRQYGDWQNRDIWEYRLALRPDEIDRVLLHLWELRDVAFPYFFFDENCSYRLLRLIEVARGDLRLEHGFPLAVLPIDTLRAAVDETGLVGEVHYRPSPASEIRWALQTRPEPVVEAALALAAGELEPDDDALDVLTQEERARAVGLAYDALRYRFLAKQVPEEVSRPRSHRLLVARSRLGRHPDKATPPTPVVRPDEAHGSAMFSIAGGVEVDEGFVDLRLRPALHDSLDPEPGESSIRVLDTTLRYYPARNRVRLHELVALELQSQSPRDAFFKPIAWKFSTGLRTRLRPEPGNELDPEAVWRSEAGLGLAWKHSDWLASYAFAELRADVGGTLRQNYALGPGLRFGVDLGARFANWRSRFELQATQFVAGDSSTWIRASLEHRLRLSRRFSLVLGSAWNHDEGRDWLDAKLELRRYF